MVQIQRNIVRLGKRSAVSRLLRANEDKEAIATWRSDLGRALDIFNVGSVTSMLSLLTSRVQTELSITTLVVVSDIRHDVVNTQTIVSDVRHDVTNTHTIVSDIRREMLAGQECPGSPHTVSATSNPPPSFNIRTLTIP